MTVFTCLNMSSNDCGMAVEFYIEGADIQVCKDIYKRIYPLLANPKLLMVFPKYIPDYKQRSNVSWYRLYLNDSSDFLTINHIKSAYTVTDYYNEKEEEFDKDYLELDHEITLKYDPCGYCDRQNDEWYAELTIGETNKIKGEPQTKTVYRYGFVKVPYSEIEETNPSRYNPRLSLIR